MTRWSINIQSKPTPTMWMGGAVVVDRRYLATEDDAAIVTEKDQQIFINEQVGETLKSETDEILKSEEDSDLLHDP